MNDNYRPEELAHLERLASRDDVQTITVAGNRGMGKTFLAHRFAENMAHHGRNVAFLTVSSASPAVDLLRLDRLLDGIGGADGPHTTHPAPARPIVILDDLAQPSSSALIERARREGALVVAIRASTRAIGASPANRVHRSNEARDSAEIELLPLELGRMRAFCDSSTTGIGLLERYLETAGIPACMAGAYGMHDIRLDLAGRFREPGLYEGILLALSSGAGNVGDIASFTGEPRTKLPAYLNRLIEEGIIERVLPFAADSPNASRKGRYRIVCSAVAYMLEGKPRDIYRADFLGRWLQLGKSEEGPIAEMGPWWGTRPNSNEHVALDLVGRDSAHHRYLFAGFVDEGIDDLAQLKRITRAAGIFLRCNPAIRAELSSIGYTVVCDRPLSAEARSYAKRMRVMRITTGDEIVEGLLQ